MSLPRERSLQVSASTDILIRTIKRDEPFLCHHEAESSTDSTGEKAPREKPLRGMASCCAYALTSTSMVLMNKYVLSGFGFKSTNTLLLYQTVCCVVLVKLTHLLGLIKLEPITWQLIKVWAPVNVIFVGMIWSSFFALKFLGVAMLTVLKNCTNLLVVFGDIVFFQRKQPTLVWVSLGLIILSALCGAATDLSFHSQGYFWQLLNCVFTAAYSLYMRGVMNKVSSVTESGKPLDEFTMVLLNNLLSAPLIIILILVFDEFPQVLHEPALQSTGFLVAATCSGVLSLAISFSSLWFLSETSPTTYSIVGSLNKIPTAVAGMIFFRAPVSMPNLLSISVGLIAGVCFTQAKLTDNKGGGK